MPPCTLRSALHRRVSSIGDMNARPRLEVPQLHIIQRSQYLRILDPSAGSCIYVIV